MRQSHEIHERWEEHSELYFELIKILKISLFARPTSFEGRIEGVSTTLKYNAVVLLLTEDMKHSLS